MELRVLKYFLTVASEENITKAAEILHITQPTLSRQIIQLEEELGLKLFNRGKTKMSLTSEGTLLQIRAKDILDLVNKTEKELQNNNDISGEIFIGAGEIHSVTLLTKLIHSFQTTYPQVKFHIYSGNTDNIKERLDKGLLDIGLLFEPTDITSYDFVKTKEVESFGILTRIDSNLAKKDFIQAVDLIDEAIIITSRATVQNELFAWFGDIYPKINFVASVNLMFNTAIMVEQGIGSAVSLEGLALQGSSNNLCFRPFFPALKTSSVLVWRKNNLPSPVLKKFILYLKNALKA